MDTELEDADLNMSFDRGRMAWPELNLSAIDHAAYAVAAKIAAHDLVDQAEDVYLAVACVRGVSGAHQVFETECLSQVPKFIRRFHLAPHQLDEVLQQVRIKQLLGKNPGLRLYRGRGPLGSWIRASAMRVAVDVVGQSDHSCAEWRTHRSDVWRSYDEGPEVLLIKAFDRDRLNEALKQSFATLKPRERDLLRLHVVEQANIDVLGRTYRVHRATAARWLVTIRERIFKDLCARASREWGASTSDLRGLLVALRDELDFSAPRVLGEA